MEPKKFYRSVADRKIAGVCGGLAEYFDIDPLLVRLIFVVLVLAGGGGFLLYLILWIVTSDKPHEYVHTQNNSNMENQQQMSGNPAPSSANEPSKPNQPGRNRGNLIGGLVLITLGSLFLADQLIPHINFGDLWPIILIVIGIGLLINSIGRRQS